MRARNLEHARANVVVGHDDVAQEHEERLIGGFLGRAMNRVAQAQRLVLVNIGNVEVANTLDLVGVSIFAAGAQRCHELRIGREVLLDGLLVAAVHDNDLVGARRQAFFDHVLNNGAVDHEQHFFRLSLGGGKEARAHARSGNQSLQRTSPIWENDAPRAAARSIAWVYCTTLERQAGKAQKGCTQAQRGSEGES